jgi:hypothetical protein
MILASEIERAERKRTAPQASKAARVKLERLAEAGTRAVREIQGQRSEVWRCQATGASPLKTSNLPQYWRELTNGNFGLLRLQVRSPAEIAATLDENGLNRGLSFDREMLPYCGRTV